MICWNNLGACLNELGRFDEASDYLEEARVLAPWVAESKDHPLVETLIETNLYNLGNSWLGGAHNTQENPKGDFEEALGYFEDALKMNIL